jgi:hypothetical protein
MQYSRNIVVLFLLCFLWACGEKPHASPQVPPAPANAPSHEKSAPAISSTSPLPQPRPAQLKADSTSSAAPNVQAPQGALEMSLAKGEWTKETPFGSRKFTLTLTNRSDLPLQLDGVLLQPSRMAHVERADGSSIEPLIGRLSRPRSLRSGSQALSLQPGATTTVEFSLADLTSSAVLDAVSYTVQVSYDGSAEGDKSIWAGLATSNKVTVNALGTVSSTDYQGRITRSVSAQSDEHYFYSQDGRLTATSKGP